MTCTVIITTRNRSADLRRTLLSFEKLRPAPEEIVICADGCDDETVEMVNQEFSSCKLIVNEVPRGSVFSRSRLVACARGEFIICLDDDSCPIKPDFMEKVKALFLKHESAAVLTFPELRDNAEWSDAQRTPTAPPCLVGAYANCAAAMRKSVYLLTSGFPPFFEHMYEEPDYALQCYALGYSVRFDPSLTIRHYLSDQRRFPMQRHHQNARNELWSVWLRCPFPQLLPVSAFRIFRQFQYACSESLTWAIREPIWWFAAAKGLLQCLSARRPVPWSIYYRWMKLARNPEPAAP